MAILEIKNLSFKFPEAANYALKDISFTVEKGEFVVLCGESGCGKSTLLRLIKKQLRPKGELSGGVYYDGTEIDGLDDRKATTDIGYVMQNPVNQTVTDKVWHELAFGLESLGEKTDDIRRRVAEICGFFGINDWYRKRCDELSGGQRQLLNLASVMVMQPEILVLDEPTSQLDPIAAADFIATLRKLNEELGVTVILVEHRLEEVFPLCHKVVLMNKATVFMCGNPKDVGKNLMLTDPEHKMLLGLPSGVRLYNMLNIGGECPLTVRESRRFLHNFATDYRGFEVIPQNYADRQKAVEISGAYFRYGRELPDVLNNLDLTVYAGEILCILGGNGAGKTTLIKAIAGLNRLYRGKLRIWGKKLKEYGGNSLYRNNVALMPQNVQAMFIKNTLEADLTDMAVAVGHDKAGAAECVGEVAQRLGISELLPAHPFDLSGGEQQKAALAKLLLTKPRIILLDEPTKGIDAYSKRNLADILYELKKQDITTVIVTHDVEFAAEHADRCAMFFDGQIVSVTNPVEFFANNSYYTTAAARISRGYYRNTVTVEELAEVCRKNGVKT